MKAESQEEAARATKYIYIFGELYEYFAHKTYPVHADKVHVYDGIINDTSMLIGVVYRPPNASSSVMESFCGMFGRIEKGFWT